MIAEAQDFADECDALAALLGPLDDAGFAQATLFKSWTIEDVIAHLFMWNEAALLTLHSPKLFQGFIASIMGDLMSGGHLKAQLGWLHREHEGVGGRQLFDLWRAGYPRVAKGYADADPDARVAWAGPEMSARAKIIARQMETWAHGQEIFDALGADRDENDRIRNICHLGVTTYSFCFRNRGQEPPSPKPYVELTAPSGAVWTWNEPQADNTVRGKATEFARVVTQTRNVADTALEAKGEAATRWLAIAQCFAGAPENPPAKGARFKSGDKS